MSPSKSAGKALNVQEVRYEGVYCDLIVRFFGPQTVVLVFSGTDIGEFGDAPFQTLDRLVTATDKIELFIDARDVRAASINVSADWAKWFVERRIHIQQVSMLTGSRFVQMTAEFVRRFADLSCLMRIYTESATFDAALAASLHRQ